MLQTSCDGVHRPLLQENMFQTAIIVIVTTLAIVPMSEETGVNTVCPPNCACNEDTLVVICKENTLNEVPITLNPAIERLILGHNKIKTVDAAAFQFYSMLKHIDFSNNQLVRIPNQAFGTQAKLIELHLNQNRLSNITDKTFHGLKSLTVLNLRGNFLEDLPNKIFNHLSRLTELDLGHNRIQRIDPETFEGLPSLKILHLDDNQLTKVPTHSFQYLSGLAELHIGLNSFRSLGNDSFARLNSLTKLDLAGAGLVNISDFAFRGLDNNLRSLILSDNELVTIPTKQLSKLSRLEELSIGQNPFSTLPKDCFKGLVNLRHLVVSGAPNLVAIDTGAFAENLNLEIITFTDNKQLKYIGDQALTGLPNLKDAILRDNGFVSFKESLVPWPLLRTFDVSGNPIDCECSLSWMRDLLLQRNTTHVLCSVPQSLKDKPLRHLTAEDLGCSTYVSTHQTIIGAICGIVVALVALLLILLYRYRHKIHDLFKNYKWKKQTKVNKNKQAEYQKTFNDDEFIIRTAQHQTLKPIPVTEL
ncbi:leucine-rich repeat neuronal protein 1-like isoform X2 [Planococcus citri]|uniref:leucine-rich repeat neuronal protein 1-like isoform X2 n=1 Tax=Planococcus citri TaxID=170843 RepID=UPI0031F830B6